MSQAWEFWIDRGGTFTDIVGRRPDGTLSAHVTGQSNTDAWAKAVSGAPKRR